MNKNLFIIVNTLSYLISHRSEVIFAARDNGYNVHVAYGELGNTKSENLSQKGINLIQIPLERRLNGLMNELKSFISIYKILKYYKPEIVHLITVKAYLYGGISARLLKIPCLITAIAGYGILGENKNWQNLILQKFLYPFFHLALNHKNQKIIVQNPSDKAMLIKKYSINSRKIILFRGSGVNLNKFINLNEEEGHVTVSFASRLLHDKGIYEFVEAARIIKKEKGIEAKFILAGIIDEGNKNSITKKELEDIRNDGLVEVIGYCENIPELFSKSNIICLPSYYGEGLPKVLMEAAAAGRAIITTNTPGCRDAIIQNESGILVPIKDPYSLANAIEKLVKNPKKRIKMGKKGRMIAEKEFKIENIVQNHLDLYDVVYDRYSNSIKL